MFLLIYLNVAVETQRKIDGGEITLLVINSVLQVSGWHIWISFKAEATRLKRSGTKGTK